MPSASSKSEKLTLTEGVDPLKQAIVILGHKIRNLEKRKSKLDSYKESNKSLTKEQIKAVAKYDEVVQHLELSKEYVKQFSIISLESDKVKKKQAKKDAQDKQTAEINRIKQILLIQDILQKMGNDRVRQDFLKGQNGAIQLTQVDLKALDDLHVEVSPKSFSEDCASITNEQFQKAAESIMVVVDGKTKEMVGSTGAKLRDLINSIHTCGYFEKNSLKEKSSGIKNMEVIEEEEESQENSEILSNIIVPIQKPTEGNLPPVQNAPPVQPMMPGATILAAAGAQPPMMQPNQHPILPPNVTNIVPTPVSQVESSFFNAQGFKPPAPPNVPPSNQNTRQINDVIQSVAGKFNFLQESELEITDMNSVVVPGNPSLTGPQIPGALPTIPTQTFTNQNFNGQPGAGPAYPPSYPPQPTAFQAFVPAFPAFVAQNASPVQTASNPNPNNPPTIAPVNSSVNPNVSANSNNINNSNKCNNISNPITNRNQNVNFNQGQPQLSSGYPSQPHKPVLPPTVSQSAFQHGNVPVGAVESQKFEDPVCAESELKEKQDNEKQDWSQPERTNWADEWTETTEWNSLNQNQSEGSGTSNKFSSGRPHRNSGNIPRNTNGYQGNRNRINRPGGYRDSQNHQGSGSNNYYHNQNGYQSRNERGNDYSTGKGPDLRDNTFRERGDYNNRDRDSYGGGYKRGPSNRGPNMKGPMDRGDKSQIQIPRTNSSGGPKVPRNVNRQPGGRGGPNYQRQQPVGAAAAK